MNPDQSGRSARRIIALCRLVARCCSASSRSSATVTAGANRADTTQVIDRLTPALVNTEQLYSQRSTSRPSAADVRC